MFPSLSDGEIAEKVAAFFNKISQEYTALCPEDCIGADQNGPETYQVAARLKYCRKPKGMVQGDIPSQCVAGLSDILALPLAHIYNRVYSTGVWPALWKKETVCVIPKTSRPSELGQLRNLSCTPLFSKVLEYFVLEQIKTEITLKATQFGGLKGSGVDHYLIETWDTILRCLEDSRAACTLASIDFEKAFNRVSHEQCLLAAQRKGASSATLALIRAFLTGWTMSVKVNSALSSPKSVPGGSPQGSLMANVLFCIVTEQLADCCDEVNNPGSDVTPTFSNNGLSGNLSMVDDPPLDFSPIRPPGYSPTPSTHSSDEDEIRAQDFIYFRPIRNRINDTVLSDRHSQPMIDDFLGVPDDWDDRDLEVRVYVDDMNVVEKTKQFGAISRISQEKRTLIIHSPKVENMFERISVKSDFIGMRVNQDKTQMICISASITDTTTTYIRPNIKGTITETSSTKSLKILGFWFDSRPGVSLQVEKICEKFRAKLWSLRILKRSGMKQTDLLRVYLCSLRPIIEYTCVTYGPMLTSTMADTIERLQLRAMKVVFGINVSYATVLRETNVEKLSSRRKTLLDKFANKIKNNPRYRDRWLPPARDNQYDIRKKKIFLEEHAKTDRLRNSPLFTIRRLLNDQARNNNR